MVDSLLNISYPISWKCALCKICLFTCASAWMLVLMSPLATWEMTKLMVEAVLLCSSSKCGETERILWTQNCKEALNLNKCSLLSCLCCLCVRLIIRTEVVYLGSGIMMGSSSSSSLCWTRSGSSHTLPWSISIISRSSWNSLGMDGCRDSVCCAFWRAWLDRLREGLEDRWWEKKTRH